MTMPATVAMPKSTKAASAQGGAGAIADHRTPLIRDCWYVAGTSAEFTRELRERSFLGEAAVLFRSEDGKPVILANRCPHRSFPLSKGCLKADHLVCGYHGMRFDTSGQCVGMPSLERAPSHVRIRAYPVMEVGPIVWVWTGDPALADPALIPQTDWLASNEWTTVRGGFHIRSNYVAMHENLLDQTHFPILHSTIGTPEYSQSTLEARTVGDEVLIARALKNSPPPPVYGVPTGLTGRPVDRYSDSRFASPAIHIAHARIENLAPREGERKEYRVNIIHSFTPEHQNSIHYWWFVSRDFALEDEGASEYLHATSAVAYKEDVDALTWIQEQVEQAGDALNEMSFGPDRPGLMMRRVLHRMAMEEAGRAHAAAA